MRAAQVLSVDTWYTKECEDKQKNVFSEFNEEGTKQGKKHENNGISGRFG